MSLIELSDTLASTARVYDDNAAVYAAGAARLSMAPEMDVFTKMVAVGGRVLDAGCGQGRDLVELMSRGYDAVGVDLSESLLTIAARSTAPTFRADLRSMPFPDGYFDGVWACASLVHLTPGEAADALAEMRRVARSGAGLFVSVKGGADAGGYEESRLGTRYFHRWQPDTFTAVVAEHGFKVSHTAAVTSAASQATSESWVELYAWAL